jgi:RimJ/RimL family protein N-acetyltransferase
MSEPGIRVANTEDQSGLVGFLSRPEIDNMFVAPLSQRAVTIPERVKSKFGTGFWLVMESQGDIIGCRGCNGVIGEAMDTVEFSTTALDPAYAGRGLGRMLLQAGVDEAFSRYRPRRMILDSWTTNTAMKRAALAVGFTEGRVYADPEKRPPGVMSVEYVLDCASLRP